MWKVLILANPCNGSNLIYTWTACFALLNLFLRNKIDNCRLTMSGLTPDRSEILSLLLDELTGNEEAINIRQDFCRLWDAVYVVIAQIPLRHYYTGSKAEGLDLPGSDDDFMIDMNNLQKIKVVQSVHEISNTPALLYEDFLLCTENVRPGFALLRRIRQHTVMLNPFLKPAIKMINNVEYLSSDEFLNILWHVSQYFHIDVKVVRQGPSMEQRFPRQDPSELGTDKVASIHCCFWPNDASEWINRSRSFGWPTSDVISSIVDFGCHLVAVGHPQSETKLMEWRLSFSIAERTLVWSFNHVQMQCYAILKLILKQFIKLKCSPQNQVLCSYFIKTFLFWKYETTPLNFWCRSNFRECIIYLLREFTQCIHKGDIRHYFLPRFNLLSVKLTPEAQTELLHLLFIVIQYDISILNECKEMRNVWSKFLLANENQMKVLNNLRKTNLLLNDELTVSSLQKLIEKFRGDFSYYTKDSFDDVFMMKSIKVLFPHIDERLTLSSLPLLRNLGVDFTFPRMPYLYELRNDILKLPSKTCLKSLLIKYLCLKTQIDSLIPVCKGNRFVYIVQQISRINESFDVSSRKLWHAIVVLRTLNYNSTLSIVNQLLSCIPPYALYTPESVSTETKYIYMKKFLNSSCTQMQRAREAWLTDIYIDKCMSDILPLAIQIELYFCRVDAVNYSYTRLILSPYVCLYYLMFLCYHELGQFDNRDRALRQLIEVINNSEQCGSRRDFSYNIAGHCLLVTGQIDRARDMFNNSRLFRMTRVHLQENSNSANWYITNFC